MVHAVTRSHSSATPVPATRAHAACAPCAQPRSHAGPKPSCAPSWKPATQPMIQPSATSASSIETTAARLPSTVLAPPGHRLRPKETPTAAAIASPTPKTSTPARGAASCSGGSSPIRPTPASVGSAAVPPQTPAVLAAKTAETRGCSGRCAASATDWRQDTTDESRAGTRRSGTAQPARRY
eukprot:scaffold14497_cov116-Isochrysis_galbana.AAC.4